MNTNAKTSAFANGGYGTGPFQCDDAKTISVQLTPAVYYIPASFLQKLLSLQLSGQIPNGEIVVMDELGKNTLRKDTREEL